MENKISLEDKLISYICFKKVFNDALTKNQILEFFSESKANHIEKILHNLIFNKKIMEIDGFYFLRNEIIEDFKNKKKIRKKLCLDLFKSEKKLLRFLCYLPFVKLLAISGSASHKNAQNNLDKEADLDLFIVVSPSSILLLFFIIRLVTKLDNLLFNLNFKQNKIKICPNYILETVNQNVKNKSFFTASDIFSLRVIKGRRFYNSFITENTWISNYLNLPKRESINYKKEKEKYTFYKLASFIIFILASICSLIKSIFTLSKFRFFKYYEMYKNPYHFTQSDGGYQYVVFERFRKIYERNFGYNDYLYNYLFPNTDTSGIKIDGKFIKRSLLTRDFKYE